VAVSTDPDCAPDDIHGERPLDARHIARTVARGGCSFTGFKHSGGVYTQMLIVMQQSTSSECTGFKPFVKATVETYDKKLHFSLPEFGSFLFLAQHQAF